MVKRDKPDNYDVKRLGYEQVIQFVPITVTKPYSSDFTFYVPAEELEGKSEEQINASMWHTFQILQYADRLIDPKKLKNPLLLEGIANCISEVASIYIAVNAASVFAHRAMSEETAQAFYIDVEAETPPQSESEEDRLFANASIEHVRTIMKPVILKLGFKLKRYKVATASIIWRNIFGHVIFDIEAERGVGSFFGMDGLEREELFNHYLDQNFADLWGRAICFYAQDIASMALDILKPAELPFKKLCSLLGIKVLEVESGPQSCTVSITDSAKLLKLIASDNPSSNVEIIYPSKDNPAYYLKIAENDMPERWCKRLPELLHGAVIQDFSLREGEFTKGELVELFRAIGEKHGREDDKVELKRTRILKELGWPSSTFDKRLEDHPELWPIYKDAYLQTRLNSLRNKTDSP